MPEREPLGFLPAIREVLADLMRDAPGPKPDGSVMPCPAAEGVHQSKSGAIPCSEKDDDKPMASTHVNLILGQEIRPAKLCRLWDVA